jgi:hypothetical protein
MGASFFVTTVPELYLVHVFVLKAVNQTMKYVYVMFIDQQQGCFDTVF